MSKLCTGKDLYNGGAARLNESRSYCGGMNYRASGTASGAPKTDNPHLANSADYFAWNRGWDLANDNGGGSMPKGDNGCCAYPGVIAA